MFNGPVTFANNAELAFTNCMITSVMPFAFANITGGIFNLHLDSNPISQLNANTFSGLVMTSSAWMGLSNCKITFIAPFTFANITGTIDQLYLYNNPISQLNANTFSGLVMTSSAYLDLSICKITSIASFSFASITGTIDVLFVFDDFGLFWPFAFIF